VEIGLYTFGDLPFGVSGPEASRNRLAEIVKAAQLADQAGLDVFGVGEHHRSDYSISVPSAVLGAIASVTTRTKLTTAVTILSSSDPVRVFEELATRAQSFQRSIKRPRIMPAIVGQVATIK
jgi:alkanesulfonate monooxygenase SsuD/methylene tetrahydromethanopterin reductase-like flavin-dependent oxidoreductase (luciferase family)